MADTRPKRQKITRTEVRDALKRSGYLLESRLESVLRDSGYLVEANVPYPDPVTQVTRELDLRAFDDRYLTEFNNEYERDDYSRIVQVFFIECINNPQPLLFITKQPNGLDMEATIKLSGVPLKLPRKDEPRSRVPFSEYFGLVHYHHYCRRRIATQYCSFHRKKGSTEWMASHDEQHFTDFRKLCDVLEYQRERDFDFYVSNPSAAAEMEPDIAIYYPALVIQGDLLEAIPHGKSLKIRSAEHLQFYRSTLKDGKTVDYQIDVVRERFFPKYLALVRREVWRLREALEGSQKALNAAKQEIAKELESAKTLKDARNALE